MSVKPTTMKRSDLKVGTIFRYHSGSVWYKIQSTRFTGLKVWSYEDESCNGPAHFEGYLRTTESNKGFTIENYIINKQVAAFFPFKDFEVVTTSNQS